MVENIRCLVFFFFLSGSLSAQTYQLYVTDAAGEPLYGVTAIAKDQQLLAESNVNGQLLLPPNLGAQDSVVLQLIGFSKLIFTPQRLGLLPGIAHAIVLKSAPNQLATVAVVGRRNELARDIPYQVEIVTAQQIATLQSPTSADALADLSGVYVQKSQFGGGSPVLRGFEANRVLLVVDGVRMNNAIFRSGHLQNAITVDVASLDRMELIYGPGSLAYGSDALGGVIHFRTRTPEFKAGGNGWKVRLQSSLASAAESKRLGAHLEYGAKNFASYTQLSFGDFGDLRAGNKRPSAYLNFGARPFYIQRINGQDSLVRNENSNRQVFSGYRQYDLLQKFRFRLKDRIELKVNIQASTSSSIPRYDALNEERDGQLRWAEWNYGPQTRLLASVRLDDRRETNLWDVTSVIASQQFIEEDRLQRRNGSPEREVSEVDVHSTNLQWDFSKAFSSGHRINYGVDARHEVVRSLARIDNIEANTSITAGAVSRYPSEGSSMSNIGVYADFHYQLSPRLEAQVGGRYNRQWLRAIFGTNDPIEWPETYLDGINNTAGAVTTAASLNYRIAEHRIRLLFAQGFRAPNVDDYAKFFQRDEFIQVPNPNLGSERSNSLELGYDYINDNWAFNSTAYVSRLNNAVIRTDFQLPDGSDFFVSFGDTLRVQSNVNADEAAIYGFDLELRRQLGKHFSLHTDFHWLRGIRREKATNRFFPQDHIAPAYGSATLKFKTKKIDANFRLRYQFAKPLERYAVNAYELGTFGGVINIDRTGTADNLELTPRDPVTGEFVGTYGWFTLNFNGQYQLNEHWTFRLGLENILDTHYRTFASGVSAPGRNVLLAVEVGF